MDIKPVVRLFTVALLGVGALACVPEQKMVSQTDPNIEMAATNTADDRFVMDSVEEVQQINSGKFKPYEL